MREEPVKLTITHHVTGQGGRYVAVVAGAAEEGYLAWEPGGAQDGAQDGREVRIATHTVVPRAIGGRGVAAALTARLVEEAQRQGFLVRPDCSYVARQFAAHPEWAPIRA